VVGGLVEEEHIGMLQKDLGQLDAHAPSTREFAGRPVEVRALKAQSGQRALHLSLIVFSSHHHIAFMGLGEPVHQCHVVLAFIIRPLGHLLLHLVELLLDLDMSREGLSCFLAHGSVILKLHHLWQIADRRAIRHRDGAGGGLLQTTEYFQHGGLSGTVLAHESDAITVVDDKTDIVEQRPGTKLHLEVLY